MYQRKIHNSWLRNVLVAINPWSNCYSPGDLYRSVSGMLYGFCVYLYPPKGNINPLVYVAFCLYVFCFVTFTAANMILFPFFVVICL